MESVYLNSTLNIAASAAPDGNFGCFTTRLPGQNFGCKVAVQETNGSPHTTTTVWDITFENLTLLLWDNVLDSRAWAFQETFLAPRTLYFTAHQLLWECISARACETFPASYEDGTITRPAGRIAIWDNPTSSLTHKWESIVTAYSGKKVTFREDKLIALSGIARLFAAKFGVTYLAGMWKEDLVFQLAWWTDDPSSVDTRDSTPSWSWAAVDTKVGTHANFAVKNVSPLVSVLEAATIVVDDDFGEVKGGRISMRCPLPFIVKIVEKKATPTFRVQLCDLVFLLFLFPDRASYSVGQELHFLLFLRGNYLDGKEITYGLVIEPVEARSYRRTGCFVVVDNTGIHSSLREQNRATYEDEFLNGEVLESDEDGKKMCTITLL
jgi:hypothetical protein